MLHAYSLKKNFLWTITGNTMYSACQWGMLIVIAKLGSPEMVGQFSLGLAICAPVIMFSSLQLRAIQATDAKNEFYFHHYFSLRLLTSLLSIVFIIILVLSQDYSIETKLVILVIGLAKTFESISDCFYGLFQQNERMDLISISMTIKGILSLTFLGFGIFFTKSVFWGALGLAITWGVILLLYDARVGLFLLKLINLDKTKKKNITKYGSGKKIFKSCTDSLRWRYL